MRRMLATIILGTMGLSGSIAGAAAPSGTDPLRDRQWGLAKVRAAQAWRTSTGAGVVVAVVDTGIDLGHPDLRGRLVKGANFVTRGAAPQDDNGHGTHVAGVIAASTGNGVGISGVAPGAKLMPVKVLDRDGNGTAEAITAGVRYAADHGARVINLSLGQNVLLGTAATQLRENVALHAAIEHAWSKGAVIIAAAGNSTVPICSEPAAARHVVCVGAVGPDDVRAWYSQGDPTTTRWFLCGPGGAGYSTTGSVGVGSVDSDTMNVLSTVARGTKEDVRSTGYRSMAGTSMAAPHVSGVAALLAAGRRSNAQIVERLLTRARDISAPGNDSVCGAGVVDAVAALQK